MEGFDKNVYTVKMAVPEYIADAFRLLPGKTTKLLQFTRFYMKLPTVVFQRGISEKTWQSGDDYLFNAGPISLETLKTDSNRIHFYGCFCRQVIDEMVKETFCSLLVVNCVQWHDTKFYFVKFFVHRVFMAKATSIIIRFATKQCNKLQDSQTIGQQMLTRHPCSTLVYHTDFKFATNALKLCQTPETRQEIVNAYHRNLVLFLFVTSTGSINGIPKTEQECIAMADFKMQVGYLHLNGIGVDYIVCF